MQHHVLECSLKLHSQVVVPVALREAPAKARVLFALAPLLELDRDFHLGGPERICASAVSQLLRCRGSGIAWDAVFRLASFAVPHPSCDASETLRGHQRAPPEVKRGKCNTCLCSARIGEKRYQLPRLGCVCVHQLLSLGAEVALELVASRPEIDLPPGRKEAQCFTREFQDMKPQRMHPLGRVFSWAPQNRGREGERERGRQREGGRQREREIDRDGDGERFSL